MGNRNLSVSTVRKSLSKNDVKGRRPEKKTLQKKHSGMFGGGKHLILTVRHGGGIIMVWVSTAN